MRIEQFFGHLLRVSDDEKIRLASKLFPFLFLSVLIVAFLALAELEAKSQETATASGIAGQESVPRYDDVWYLKQLLARDSADMDPVKWMFDVLDHPEKHPMVRVMFKDTTSFAFVSFLSFSERKILFQIDRTLIRASDSGTTSPTQRDMARLQFVREAVLAMLLERENGLELYLSCANVETADANCFRMLVIVHLMALQAQWRYAESHDLARVFPESIARDRNEFTQAGISPENAELRALTIYGLQGQLRNLFWARRYEEFLDEMAAQSAAD